MRSYLSDQDAIIPVLFMDGDEPFVPDQDSVEWSLRDHSGVLVSGFVDQAQSTGVADVRVNLTVPAAQNTIASGKEFEKRTIIVSATRYSGLPWTAVVPYRIVPWSNHTVDENTVRNLAGLDDMDLRDQDIDVWIAYVTLRSRIGSETLEAALISGTNEELLVNRAIAATAVLQSLPAVSNRILKRRTDGSLQAERFKFDRELLETTMRGHIDAAVVELTGESLQSPHAFAFGAPTDPVTG